MIDIAAIEARLAAATPGPWEPEHRGVVTSDGAVVVEDCLPRSGWERYQADQDLIVHAPTDLTALVARVRELEAERDASVTAHKTTMGEVLEYATTRDRRIRDLASAVARLENNLAVANLHASTASELDAAVEAERDALRAIIEGRAEGPTNDELTAHDAAGGGWMVRPQGFTVSVTMGGPSYTHAWRERLSTQDHPARWWPLDASGRPCAWPVATGGSSE